MDEIINYNYHTHTYLCSHATGTPEGYIRRAVECGVKHMGFSEHAPFVRCDGAQSTFRLPVEKVDEYFDILNSLREKYKDKIDIKIGFEMEYYPDNFREMFNAVKKYGGEYLIAGEHFVRDEGTKGVHSAKASNDPKVLEEYVSCIVSAIKSGVFTYIAHPDMLNFTGDILLYREKMRYICKASREYNVPVEINCLGIRGRRHYPNPEFWKLAGEEGSPVTIGFDAHDEISAFDGVSAEKAMEMVKKYSLNYIGKPQIRLIQNICI